MRVNIEEIGITPDEKYFRVWVKIGKTHILHSEKLNEATAEKLLGELLHD